MTTASPIGCRTDKQFIEPLYRPTLFHEPLCKVVKKLRMSREGSTPPEVAWVTCDPPAEMPAPHPVDHHSGGEGILFIHNPFRERQTPLAPALRKIRSDHLSQGHRCTQRPGRYRSSSRIDISPGEDAVLFHQPLAPGIARHHDP